MAKPEDKAASADKAPAKNPERITGPSKEQLAGIHSGGSYTFDPATKKLSQSRKPAKAATVKEIK